MLSHDHEQNVKEKQEFRFEKMAPMYKFILMDAILARVISHWLHCWRSPCLISSNN